MIRQAVLFVVAGLLLACNFNMNLTEYLSLEEETIGDTSDTSTSNHTSLHQTERWALDQAEALQKDAETSSNSQATLVGDASSFAPKTIETEEPSKVDAKPQAKKKGGNAGKKAGRKGNNRGKKNRKKNQEKEENKNGGEAEKPPDENPPRVDASTPYPEEGEPTITEDISAAKEESNKVEEEHISSEQPGATDLSVEEQMPSLQMDLLVPIYKDDDQLRAFASKLGSAVSGYQNNTSIILTSARISTIRLLVARASTEEQAHTASFQQELATLSGLSLDSIVLVKANQTNFTKPQALHLLHGVSCHELKSCQVKRVDVDMQIGPEFFQLHQQDVAVEKEAANATKEDTSVNKPLNPSWRPSHEWLNACVADLATNRTGIQVRYFTKRDGYGLGDCIKMCARCGLGKINRRDKNLALQYQNKACYMNHPNYRSGGNLEVVEELLAGYQAKFKPPEPPQDAIVLHLRVGDVIEKSKQSTEELLISGGDPFHTPEFKSSIKSTYEYLDNIEESGATNVIVVGGVFQKKHYKSSRVYQGCLERAFKEAGYNVTMQMDSGEADLDFYYMTRAKKFVVSSGGFSALIAKLVVRNGGKVVGRTFDDPEGVAKYERSIIRKQTGHLKKKK